MKKFNIEVIIDATPEQLAQVDIKDVRFCGQQMTAWDFNTIAGFGPAAKVYAFYNEDEYFLVPMKYIQFKGLTLEQAEFIYPDAEEMTVTYASDISIDTHIWLIEQKGFEVVAKAIYHEITGDKLKVIISRSAHRTMLIEEFIFKTKELGLKPICDNEYIHINVNLTEKKVKHLIELYYQYIGVWRSVAIKTDHDRENKIARYHIKYTLITGEDLSTEQLTEAVEYIQNRL